MLFFISNGCHQGGCHAPAKSSDAVGGRDRGLSHEPFPKINFLYLHLHPPHPPFFGVQIFILPVAQHRFALALVVTFEVDLVLSVQISLNDFFCLIKEKYGSVGLIHVDAHCDVNEHMNNCAIAHGTTFRRALEHGCLDPKRVVQIGLRGSGHSVEDYAWPLSQVMICLCCLHKLFSFVSSG